MKRIIILLCLLFPLTATAKVNIQYGVEDSLRDIKCTQPSAREKRQFKTELRLFLKKYKPSTLSQNLSVKNSVVQFMSGIEELMLKPTTSFM